MTNHQISLIAKIITDAMKQIVGVLESSVDSESVDVAPEDLRECRKNALKNVLVSNVAGMHHLSSRTSLFCMRNDINTIYDLAAMGSRDIMKKRGVGKKTYDELCLLLLHYGTHFGEFKEG